MAGGEAMIVAGIGCRRGTPAAEIERVLAAALAKFGVERGELKAVATEESKAAEDGIREIAERLAVPLRAFSAAELDSVSDMILTVSQRALEIKGTASIAEGAALVAAGRNAWLLGPRVATETATCAIAVGDGAAKREDARP
jgi:cobalt-precorrin 5A hydrolase